MSKGLKIALAVIGVIGVGTAIYFIAKPKKNSKKSDGSKTPLPTEELPIDPTTGKEANDNFPLHLGSAGNRVRRLRMGLELTPTMFFDKETETALNTKFKRKTVTEADYNWMAAQIKQWTKIDIDKL